MYKDFYNNKLVPFINKVRMACNVGEIPLVFDNSLTYYEQIAAFSAKLNDVINTVNVQSLTLCEFMQQLTEAFKELSDEFAEKWSEIQSEFAAIGGKINGMKLDISDLDERVTALEEKPTGGVGQQITEGTQYEYEGETYTAGANCEIFGCYETQGSNTKNEAAGNYSHAEGVGTKAYFAESHAEGKETITLARASHAEGIGSQTQAQAAHAEGSYTTASEFAAHAEGENTTASGRASHAEGYNTVASGSYSHAGGNGSTASGTASIAIGTGTTAAGDNMVAIGSYNNSTTGSYLVIGDGTDENTKHDLFKITTDGKFAFRSNTPFDPQTDHEKLSNAGSFVPVSLTPTITEGDNVRLDNYSMTQCGKVVTFYAKFTTNNNIYGGIDKLLLTLSDFPKAAHDVIFMVTTTRGTRPVMFANMAANTATWEARYSNLQVDIDSGYIINIYGTYITSD